MGDVAEMLGGLIGLMLGALIGGMPLLIFMGLVAVAESMGASEPGAVVLSAMVTPLSCFVAWWGALNGETIVAKWRGDD